MDRSATVHETSKRNVPSRPAPAIRRLQVEDRDLLADVIADLPYVDRERRFHGNPPPDFVDDWIARTQRDGYAVIAVADDGRGPRGVGEAGYVRQGERDAEFAVSVVPGWRGGLGGRLLDRLLDRAAAEGVTNLWGRVRADNRPMLRLLYRRGGVILARDEPGWIGFAIGTIEPTPRWPVRRPGRRRVLIEASAARWAGEAELRAAGYDVAVCPGPAARALDRPCPLLAGHACPLVDGADLIIHALRSQDPEATTLLSRLHGAGRPVRVEACGPSARRGADGPVSG